MVDPIVLDTCALADTHFLSWLRSYRGRKILPTVAFYEFYTFMTTKGRTYGEVMNLLHRVGIEIESFNLKHAHHAAETLPQSGFKFLKHWRDHAIAGHAHTAPLKVITYDVKDFAFLGDRVLTPQDLMRGG